MPRQNRVTPFGAIIATDARGTLMGNRGCLHDAAGSIRRQYAVTRWIVCLLDFKGRRRAVMTPGYYTELFFLDEATALAAGHRPCAECQRSRFDAFRRLWAAANPDLAGGAKPAAPALDAALHRERLDATRHKRTYLARLGELPPGAFVLLGGDPQPYLVRPATLLRWMPQGYAAPVVRPDAAMVQVLTPRSVVRILIAGYLPMLHPSAYTGV